MDPVSPNTTVFLACCHQSQCKDNLDSDGSDPVSGVGLFRRDKFATHIDECIECRNQINMLVFYVRGQRQR